MNKFIISRLFVELTVINLKLDQNKSIKTNRPNHVLFIVLCKMVGLKLTEPESILANASNTRLLSLIIDDLLVNFKRDPSCHSFIDCTLKPGFKVVSLYRLCPLFGKTNKILTHIKTNYGIEIGHGVWFGKRLILDHTHGTVIGQQAKIGDNVILMHGITLGSIGNQLGLTHRHPEVQSGSNVGTNTTILGRIKIGHCTNIGANAVVTKQVLPYNVLVGVPAQALLS
ncbi:Serine acetyltransferase [Candidatus Hodgkinia cicadicola]|uniref:Serine acetyltransferase n=1 Tax=Candidatus Hodgkinia cicadicola TaxID=573658 RepID=A0ABX4MGP6_9HYPH|nr:Serine acetyltransferase [Candidatus Hodgkinia cicadicola]